MSDASYRTILRSSWIIGGAQVINIVVGLVKMKVVAVLLGPAGVGLVGLFTNLMQTAAEIAAMGIGNVGTRQIAAANADGGQEAVDRTRRVLFLSTLLLATAGAVVFWLASDWIARVVLDDETRATEVAWLSLGVACTVAVGAQGALLAGLRRIGDLARVKIWASVLGAALGVLLLWSWDAYGLLALVLAGPVVTCLVGYVYVARLGPPSSPPAPLPEMAREWRVMATLGFAFMLSSLIAMLGQLGVRTLVQHELGPVSLGHFQASWMIGMSYVGFVVGAMGTDYYPRLTSAIGDPAAASRLVNEQTEVALLLSGPVLLVLLGLAPWVIRLLYSAEFAPATGILRWQLLGDVLKVMSWPLGFVLLAAGAGKTFVAAETAGMGVFLLGVHFGLPQLGVTATGIAFLALYVVYLPLVRWLCGRMIGFRWTRAVRNQALVVMAAAIAVDLAGRWSDLFGAALGIAGAAALGVWALMHLSRKSGAEGRLGRIGAASERLRSRLTPRPPDG